MVAARSQRRAKGAAVAIGVSPDSGSARLGSTNLSVRNVRFGSKAVIHLPSAERPLYSPKRTLPGLITAQRRRNFISGLLRRTTWPSAFPKSGADFPTRGRISPRDWFEQGSNPQPPATQSAPCGAFSGGQDLPRHFKGMDSAKARERQSIALKPGHQGHFARFCSRGHFWTDARAGNASVIGGKVGPMPSTFSIS